MTASLTVFVVVSSLVAHAQTTPLTQYSSATGYGTITTDGLTFTVTSCTYTAQGTSSAVACNPGAANNLAAGDELAAIVSGSAATIQVVNGNGGSVLSLTSNPSLGSTNQANISFTVNVQPSSAQAETTVSNINSVVAGTTTKINELPLITSGLSWTSGAMNYNLNADAGGTTSGPINFAATNSLNVSYKLALSATSGTNTGDVLSLNSARSTFSPAPEPATLLLLGPAAFAITRLRKSRSRSAKRKV